MKWIKKGLIFGASGQSEWMMNSALQPTPILIGGMIRVYVGFRDKNGVGRVGYVDLNAENPSEILDYSRTPALDVGEAGCFDDNGCVPCSVFRDGEQIYLYYAGYNLGHHVRMTIFSGLAVSCDYGRTFERCSKVPVMERTEHETLFRVVHTAMKDSDGWKFYYGAGNHFIQGRKKTLPVYEIELLQSSSPFQLKQEGKTILCAEGEEYRIGRPYVIKEGGLYKMFFCKGTEKIVYRLSYAESEDGVNWNRREDELNLALSDSGWDSEMMAYPAFVRYKDKGYLFYNGNNYGYEGFGYAELAEESHFTEN